MLFFRNFPVANNLMNKRGGENIKFFRGQFFVSQCRKCSKGNTLVFHLFLVSNNVVDKRGAGGF